MKRLIVNADDFGMTEGVNRGILDAHQKGIVTSTTLLANGEAFAAAVALGRQAPRLGIGVHLNLSEGLPVASAVGSTIVNRQGRLHLTPGRLFAAIAGRRVLLADVEGELRAQVRKVLDAGIVPTHLDGHMHVHVLPGVSEIIVRIARDSGIPAIRCPIERVGNPLRRVPASPEGSANKSGNALRSAVVRRRWIALGVSVAALRLRWIAKRARLAYPARFYGIAETGALGPRTMAEILGALPNDDQWSELMCHPGYMDDNLGRLGGEIQAERQAELEALTAPAVIEKVKRDEIRLMSYADLAGKIGSGPT